MSKELEEKLAEQSAEIAKLQEQLAKSNEVADKQAKVIEAQMKKFDKTLKQNKIVDGVVKASDKPLVPHIPAFEVFGQRLELLPGIHKLTIPQLTKKVKLKDGDTVVDLQDSFGRVNLELVVKYRPVVTIGENENTDILEYLFEQKVNIFQSEGVAVFGKGKPTEVEIIEVKS